MSAAPSHFVVDDEAGGLNTTIACLPCAWTLLAMKISRNAILRIWHARKVKRVMRCSLTSNIFDTTESCICVVFIECGIAASISRSGLILICAPKVAADYAQILIR